MVLIISDSSGGLPGAIFMDKTPSLYHFWCVKTIRPSLYTTAKHCGAAKTHLAPDSNNRAQTSKSYITGVA